MQFFKEGIAATGYYKCILAPMAISCVALGKSLNLSERHILHLLSGDIMLGLWAFGTDPGLEQLIGNAQLIMIIIADKFKYIYCILPCYFYLDNCFLFGFDINHFFTHLQKVIKSHFIDIWPTTAKLNIINLNTQIEENKHRSI